jgi:hypothetical protein
MGHYPLQIPKNQNIEYWAKHRETSHFRFDRLTSRFQANSKTIPGMIILGFVVPVAVYYATRSQQYWSDEMKGEKRTYM